MNRTSSLRSILNPISADFFFQEHFESKPLIVVRREADYFRDLLTLDDVDRLLTTIDASYPEISLVNAEREIETSEFTSQEKSIDVAQLYRLYADGATIILNHLNTRHPPLAELCAALELEFSAPFQTNIYLTPARAKGFKTHFDTHDVFVLQLHGSKQWRLYDTPIPLPLYGQNDEINPDNPGIPTAEFELHSGDTLYIPRGLFHDAVSRDETSLHVTVGVHSYTCADAIFEALATVVLNDPAFRRSLPRGFARVPFNHAAAREQLRDLIDRFSTSADIDAALDTFVHEFIDGRRPRLRGQMADLRSLENLTLNSSVTSRTHLAYAIWEDDTTIRVRCYGKEISIPRYALGAVRYALAASQFQVRELPSELDDDSKLVLVRRLVREGLLRIVRSDQSQNTD